MTRELVDDLKLEGFACSARFTKIECMQIEPLRNKQPALCSTLKGCVKQPDQLVYNLYTIRQSASGVPEISHSLVRKKDSLLF